MAKKIPVGAPIDTPPSRRLRVYAFDPSLATKLDTVEVNEVTLKIRWEDKLEQPPIETRTPESPNQRGRRTSTEADAPRRLRPGPVGQYIEVVDFDPASDCFYRPVDLNDPHLLAQDGLPPSEGNPQFHQQMVYAVGMKTIEHFERALGRLALWSPRTIPSRRGDKKRYEYVPRLRIYPHALREANAYYSMEKKALLFGYFSAGGHDGINLPGGVVFTCLSHDIIAHEMTHALLDGLHPRFIEGSNPDVLAFHEAFADIVALFQHFTMPEVLRHQLAKTRGDLGAQNLLGELAQQFGQAIGNRGALRSALGETDHKTGQWKPHEPSSDEYERHKEAHARGAVLVSAVFDAFLAIYRRRIADLLRIATGGSGVLPQGDLHPDLVNRLADEASKTAGHVLHICIRALDYCPPMDLTFGEYLRALITADHDVVPDDKMGYRVAFIDAFRKRGIYPWGVRALSTDSLRWQSPEVKLPRIAEVLQELWLKWDLDGDRKQIHKATKANGELLHKWIEEQNLSVEQSRQLGLMLGPNAHRSIRRKNGKPVFEVHSCRPTRRVAQSGDPTVELVVEITQSRLGAVNPKEQKALDKGRRISGETFKFRGGCTLILDVETGRVRYCICKYIDSNGRLDRERKFRTDPEEVGLAETYFSQNGKAEPVEHFAMLHRTP